MAGLLEEGEGGVEEPEELPLSGFATCLSGVSGVTGPDCFPAAPRGGSGWRPAPSCRSPAALERRNPSILASWRGPLGCFFPFGIGGGTGVRFRGTGGLSVG